MKDNRKKYLIKNTLIFTLGNFGSKFIAFFLIPLYTNVLTVTEYGTVDLVATVGTVAIPILTLNICESVMRFALDKNQDKNQITQIGTYFLWGGAIVGLIIFPISHCFDQLSPYSMFVYLYILTLAASQFYLSDLRGKELLFFYSVGNILNTFLVAVCNILFLLVFQLGIKGYLSAYIVANLFTAVYAAIVGKGYRSFKISKINKNLLTSMVKYSVVLIPNSFMWWIMNSSDRLMVSGMVSIAANGIYAISYKFPTLISTITQIFNQAWSYSAIKEEGADDETEYNNRVLRAMTAAVMIIGVCMMALIKFILKIYVSPEYYIAWKYTPFLIVGFVYSTIGSFVATSYVVHKDSVGFLVSGIFGAVLNIILNFLLIPKIGVTGAALSTCISYIVVFVFRIFDTRKYMKYNIVTKEFIVGTITLMLTGVLTFIDHAVAQSIQIFLGLLLIAVFHNMWLPYVKKILRKISDKHDQ